MKVLITGGAGFIGFHLSKYLAEKGFEVTICDNLFRGRPDDYFKKLVKKKNVKFIKMDLTEKRNMDKLEKDFDTVYHLAAINGTRYFYEIPDKVLRTNILSLINMLDWLIDTECKKMVWTSSSETYAGTNTLIEIPIPTPEEIPLVISEVFNPRFSYAGSKIIGELLCINYTKVHNLNVSIVRPHNIYGPRMGFDHVIPELIMKLKKASNNFSVKEVELGIQGSGDETRAFCYIDDMVEAMMLVAERGNSCEIYNIGNDTEEVSIKELTKRISQILGLSISLIASERPIGSPLRRCPNIQKIKRLGFNPSIDLDTGLKETTDFYYGG